MSGDIITPTYILPLASARIEINVQHGGGAGDSLQFGYNDDAGLFVPISLFGSTIELVVRPRWEQDPIIVRLATGAGIVHLDEANGKFAYYLAQTLVDTLPVGSWPMGLRQVFSSTPVVRARGTFSIFPMKY